MSDNVITLEHVSKSYGKNEVLHDINMTVKRGEIYGLVGNNGAGKTTIMRILTGLSSASEGEVSLFGEYSEKQKNNMRKRTGVMIDNPGFYENMSARENLEYFRRQFGIPGAACIDEVLNLVGLSDTGKKKYKAFSMGMKQRLGIALAMMNSPELLILDEPINGIDPSGIIELRNILKDINHKKNTTILISSHILAEMSNIATCYGFISHGHLMEQISSEDLLNKCGVYLDIIVRKPELLCTLLEGRYGDVEYKVYPDGHVHLLNHINDEEDLCKLAVEGNVGLRRLEKKSISLEDYYMSVINREVYNA